MPTIAPELDTRPGVPVPAALRDAVDDLVPFLADLAASNCAPVAAMARLDPLRERHPETDIELVWDEESYDRSIQYDALVTVAGLGTVSLSFCPETAVPWPLRGVLRWDDMCLVRVNDTPLDIAQAVACLDFVWQQAPLAERLVNVCLIQEALAREAVQVTPDELQSGMDAFRRAHRLYTAEGTREWMRQRGLTHTQLERLVADEVTVAKLRERVTARQVADQLRAHPELESDPHARLELQKRLFDAWLAERRRSARIEWNWGRAGQGPSA